MAELKTRPTDIDPKEFIATIEHKVRHENSQQLLTMFSKISGKEPVMWGDSIIGFGTYRYTNTSGTYDWPTIGFSPRKQNISIYIMLGFERYQHLIDKLGKAKTARSCLYITQLKNVDMDVLEELCTQAYQDMLNTYECS